MRGFRILVVCGAVLSIAALGSEQDVRKRVRNPNGRGSWTNHLWIAEGLDGLRFRIPKHLLNSAVAPAIVTTAKGSQLLVFQWYSSVPITAYDRMAYTRSIDGGTTWTEPRTLEVRGVPDGYTIGGDPALVLLEDGTIRLYFRGRIPGSRSACIFSAHSIDDVTFRFEPGVRFTVPGEEILDATVARIGTIWRLIAPITGKEGRAYHAESPDGLQFKRVADLQIDGGRDWLGNAVSLPRGIRFFGTARNVWSADSMDGRTWTANHVEAAIGADPAVARTAEGRWLIITTGPKDMLQTMIPESPPPPPFP